MKFFNQITYRTSHSSRYFFFLSTLLVFLYSVPSYKAISTEADATATTEAPQADAATTEEAPQAEDTGPTDPLNDSSTFDRLCVPQNLNTDIIHFPMERWTPGKNKLKVLQSGYSAVKEHADSAIQFIRQQFTDNEDNPTDDPTIETEQALPIVETIARSQFALAKLISYYPRPFVFHEFLTNIHDRRELKYFLENQENQDFVYTHPDHLPDVENRNLSHLFQLTTAQFPNGIPEKYTDLTKDQKHTLAIIGGTHILFFLDELPVILPSLSPKDYQKIFPRPTLQMSFYYETLFCDYYASSCSSTDEYLVRVLKTEYMAKTVNSFLTTFFGSAGTPEQPVILAYTGNINLQDYFTDKKIFRVPKTCFQVPEPPEEQR